MDFETITKYNDCLKTIRGIRGKWRKNAEGLRLLAKQLAENKLDALAISRDGTAIIPAPSPRMHGQEVTVCKLNVLDGQGFKSDFQKLEQANRERERLEVELRNAGLVEIIQSDK